MSSVKAIKGMNEEIHQGRARSERIESRKNARFKQFKALLRKSEAKKTDRILIEGTRLCSDALSSGVAIEAVLLSDSAYEFAIDWLSFLPDDVPCFILTDELFAQLSDTKNPQGIALICKAPVQKGPRSPARVGGLYLAADGMADPGNLGTLIRTADAFSFDAVLLTAGTVWPANPKVIRASMGSCFHLPIILFDEVKDLVDYLAPAGIPLYAADPKGSLLIENLPPGGGALLVGNEAHGLSEEARKSAAFLVSIPMPGRAESLNAAVAASICAYEMMKANRLN